MLLLSLPVPAGPPQVPQVSTTPVNPQWSLLAEGKAGVDLQSAEDGVDLPVGPISSDEVGDHPHQAQVLN